MGKVPSEALKAQREQDLLALGAALPDAVFSAALAEGQRVALEDAFAAVQPGGGLP